MTTKNETTSADDEATNCSPTDIMTSDLETGDTTTAAATSAAAAAIVPKRTHTHQNIQVIQWPPRSPWQVAKNGLNYVKTITKPLELAFLGCFILFCYNLPFWILEQHQREIPVQTTSAGDVIFDFAFNRPKTPSTFPGPTADKWTVYIPISFYLVVGSFFGPQGDFHATFSTYLLAIALKIFVVEAVKRYTGVMRPNFFTAACHFDETRLDCGPNGPSPHGFTSFPSGHAATAMTSGMIWTLYLLTKIVGFTRQRQSKTQRYWAPSFPVKLLMVAACLPLGMGIFIATSRMMDDWHHPSDVLAGIELGVGTALFAHAMYYPTIFGENAGIPRTTLAELGGGPSQQQQTHRDDDEDEQEEASEERQN